MIQHIRMHGQSGEWEVQLLRKGAPLGMMRRLFGTSKRKYEMKRRFFAVPAAGIPSEPDEKMAIRLRRLLMDRIRQAPDGRLTPHDYLMVCEESGASPRTVWREAKRQRLDSG